MTEIVKTYESDQLIVTWKPERCRHAAKCVQGSPNCFMADRRPWIKLDEDTTEHIMQVIDQCPSGALSYKKK